MKLFDVLSETVTNKSMEYFAAGYKSGNFVVKREGLKSLEGSPEEISGDFNCRENSLNSLEGGPSIVSRGYDCSYNNLVSLKGSPKRVEAFVCQKNNLISLEGGPSEVDESFDCDHNKLTSLEGAPHTVGSFFSCEDNKLTSLHNIHKIIKKMSSKMGTESCTLYASRNPITSHVLGVLLIDGCKRFILDNDAVELIVSKYLPNKEGMKGVLKCQEELFAADLDEYAQL